jgi:hypothetical protein
MGLLTVRLLNSNSVKVRSLISATWRTDEDLTDTVVDWFWRFRVSSSPFQSRTAVAENASSFDVLPRVVKFEIRKRRTGWKHACTYYSIQSVSNPVILNLWSHEWDGEDAGGQCQTRSVNLGKPWYVQYNARWHAMRDGISELSRGEGTKESWGKGHGCYCCTSTHRRSRILRRRRLETIATAGAPN